jgi:predicted acetyltransferase
MLLQRNVKNVMIRLVKPTVKYWASYLKAMKEFQKEGRPYYDDLGSKCSLKQFGEFVGKLRSREKGRNLPKGHVSESHFWLIDGDSFIGRTSVRHRLTPKLKIEGGHIGYEIRPSKRTQGYGTLILALVIRKARQMGFKKVLVTCNEDNVGSRKIIESNGGVYENRLKAPSGKVKLRYWIHFKKKPHR